MHRRRFIAAALLSPAAGAQNTPPSPADLAADLVWRKLDTVTFRGKQDDTFFSSIRCAAGTSTAVAGTCARATRISIGLSAFTGTTLDMKLVDGHRGSTCGATTADSAKSSALRRTEDGDKN